MITVVIVEDNPMVRAGLRALLEADGGFQVLAEAADGRSGLAAVARHLPAVTLLDHRMPIADGLDMVDRLAELTRVLMLTSDGSADIVRAALACGAHGFIVHGELHPHDLPRAVRALAAGQVWLSPSAAAVAVQSVRARAEAGVGDAAAVRADPAGAAAGRAAGRRAVQRPRSRPPWCWPRRRSRTTSTTSTPSSASPPGPRPWRCGAPAPDRRPGTGPRNLGPPARKAGS